ncbi:MAG: single-stranded-DNA-specific exonuclease RecJ, partial [Phototrophicales bacterium]
MKTWLEPSPISVPEALRAEVGGHDLVAASLVRRGITSATAARQFLDPAQYTPASPDDLPDMDKAVHRLQ